MPRSVGDLPVYYNHHRSADWNHYLEGESKTVFPFGHGISYTTFDVSAPRLRKDGIRAGEAVELEVTVINTGTRAGDEVVQIYMRDEISSVPRPILELKAFRRVALAAGETRMLSFTLDSDALAFWDSEMQWRVEPGEFTIFAGPSSANLKSAKLVVAAA
jgi:beta-glucosidase